MEVKITKFPLRLDVGYEPIIVYYFALNYELKAYLISVIINKIILIKYCSIVDNLIAKHSYIALVNVLTIVLKDKCYVLRNIMCYHVYTIRLEAIESDVCWGQIRDTCRPGARAFTLERVYSRWHTCLPADGNTLWARATNSYRMRQHLRIGYVISWNGHFSHLSNFVRLLLQNNCRFARLVIQSCHSLSCV